MSVDSGRSLAVLMAGVRLPSGVSPRSLDLRGMQFEAIQPTGLNNSHSRDREVIVKYDIAYSYYEYANFDIPNADEIIHDDIP